MRKIMLLVVLALALGLLATGPVSATTVTLNPVDDAYVDHHNINTNYNNDNLIVAGSNSDYDKRIFLKFNLSSIPNGATITQANLSLYLTDSSSDYSEDAKYVSTDTWVEGTITWNNQPAIGGLLDNATTPADNHWETWNLSPAWSYATDLTDNYLSLAIVTDEGNYSNDTYASFESCSNLPKLVITYDECQIPVPPTVLLLGSGLVSLALMRRRFKG